MIILILMKVVTLFYIKVKISSLVAIFFSNGRSSSQLHYGNRFNYNKLKSNKTIGILYKMIKVKMVDQFWHQFLAILNLLLCKSNFN